MTTKLQLASPTVCFFFEDQLILKYWEQIITFERLAVAADGHITFKFGFSTQLNTSRIISINDDS